MVLDTSILWLCQMSQLLVYIGALLLLVLCFLFTRYSMSVTLSSVLYFDRIILPIRDQMPNSADGFILYIQCNFKLYEA